jgi:hypothetical protein
MEECKKCGRDQKWIRNAVCNVRREGPLGHLCLGGLVDASWICLPSATFQWWIRADTVMIVQGPCKHSDDCSGVRKHTDDSSGSCKHSG